MAHICLINPAGIKSVTSLQMHTPNPPIGLAYIAAAVREAGHRVTVIDAAAEAMDQISPMPGRPDILVQGLTTAQTVGRIPADVDIIGLSCTFSPLWPLARATLEAAHETFPDVPIIAGGEHTSALPDHVLQTSPTTVCVIGEGEETVVELLACLLEGGDMSAVRGIAFRADEEIVRTPPRPRTKAVDDIPLPAWDLLPITDYIDRRQNNGINQGRAMPILATRGCPFRCTFCSSPQMWTTAYTMRDPARVCDEIEVYLYRYGATDFHFQDLTAIVSKKWTIAFCKEVVRRGLNITWQLPSGTRSEAIDEEACKHLAAAGVKQMAYAPESGSAHMRKLIDKRVHLDKMMTSVRAALRHRLTLSCFFVIGFPKETTETLRETLRLIRRLALMGVHDVSVTKFVPYPGSALFDEMLAAGRIELNDDFFLSPFSFYDNKGAQDCHTDELSAEQLHRWMIRLFTNFYVLSFLRHPLRTAINLVRVVLTGTEETRYAKWFSDMFKTRRKWRRAARQQRNEVDPSPAGVLTTATSDEANVGVVQAKVRVPLPVVNRDTQEVPIA